jgi:hypothetical protein
MRIRHPWLVGTVTVFVIVVVTLGVLLWSIARQMS